MRQLVLIVKSLSIFVIIVQRYKVFFLDKYFHYAVFLVGISLQCFQNSEKVMKHIEATVIEKIEMERLNFQLFQLLVDQF